MLICSKIQIFKTLSDIRINTESFKINTFEKLKPVCYKPDSECIPPYHLFFSGYSQKNWDGFQRINTETKSGGIVGVFKQLSAVDEQCITLNFLDEKKEYVVKLAPSGEIISRGIGSKLRKKGFKVIFKEEANGELFEVEQIQ